MNRFPKYGIILMVVITAVASVALIGAGPIPQNPAYHVFADQRTIATIPNFMDVFSNLLFFAGGLLGMARTMIRRRYTRLFWPHMLFFLGIFLTTFGSAAYHLHPDNRTLLYDRLPMTVVFMAFFTIVLDEYLSASLARAAFWPLLVSGMLSVITWYILELEGRGDLRFYLLVQFLPLVLIPVILVVSPQKNKETGSIWFILALYAAAKIFEIGDEPVFRFTGFISGHTIKHLLAGIAPLILLQRSGPGQITSR